MAQRSGAASPTQTEHRDAATQFEGPAVAGVAERHILDSPELPPFLGYPSQAAGSSPLAISRTIADVSRTPRGDISETQRWGIPTGSTTCACGANPLSRAYGVPESHGPHAQKRRGRYGAQLKGLEEPDLRERHNIQLQKLQEINEEISQHYQIPQRTAENPAPSIIGQEECLLTNDDDARGDITPVLGCRSTQWRPTQPNQETRLATMLETTLRRLTDALRPQKKTYRAVAPRFEGTEHENPKAFLRNIERFCINENYDPDEWTAVAADQLKLEAHTWYNSYRHFNLSFAAFQRHFLEKLVRLG